MNQVPPFLQDLERRLGESLETFMQREYTQKNRSRRSLERELRIGPRKMDQVFNYAGLRPRTKKEAARLRFGNKPIPKERLEELYIQQERTPAECAALLGVNQNRVASALNDYGLRRTVAEARMLKTKGRKPSREELDQEYTQKKRTTTDIAEEYNVTSGTISSWLDEYKIPKRTSAESRLARSGGWRPSDEELYDLRIVHGLTKKALAARCNVGLTTIDNWLRKANIPNPKDLGCSLEEAVASYLEYCKDEEDPTSIRQYFSEHKHYRRLAGGKK